MAVPPPDRMKANLFHRQALSLEKEMRMPTGTRSKTETVKMARRQRGVQRKVDASDRRKPKPRPPGPMQAGARKYPVPPFPMQHHPKPGEERMVEPAPLYDAPFWQGSNKLAGKVALITGGDSGIGRAVAVLFAREGADVAITYLVEEENDARETKAAVENEGRRALIVAGDLQDEKFCRKAVDTTIDNFGKLDILEP